MADSELTSQQEKALAELLNQPTVAKAAAAAKVSERTLYRWLAEPTFDAQYRQRRRQAVGHATAQLQRAAGAAVVVLSRLMISDATPAAVRRQAACDILTFAIKSVELDDLAARIEALEFIAKDAQ